jgi:CHAT domain-containing protein/tetratricopeptide (TPR) repeat protein
MLQAQRAYISTMKKAEHNICILTAMKKSLCPFTFTLFAACLTLESSFSQTAVQDSAAVNHLLQLSEAYAKNAKADSAILYAEKALNLNTLHAGRVNARNAEILVSLGKLSSRVRKYDIAVGYFTKALEMKKELPGVESRDLAGILFNTGHVYYRKHEWDKCLDFNFKALGVLKNTTGENQPLILDIYDEIGTVWYYKGDYDKALDYFFITLQKRKELLGEINDDVVNSYMGIGVIYLDKGDYRKALEYNLKALQTDLGTDGKEDAGTALLYVNIGNIYLKNGEPDKALEYFLKSLKIREDSMKEKTLEGALNYNSIAAAYDVKGDYMQASEYYNRALKLLLELYGEKNSSVAMIYVNLGGISSHRGEYDKALQYCLKALQIYGEPRHPVIASIYNDMGGIYINKGEYARAIDFENRALSINREFLGSKHPDLTVCFSRLGDICDLQGDYLKALEYYQKGIAGCMNEFNDTTNVYSVPRIKECLNWKLLLVSLKVKARILTDLNKNLPGMNPGTRREIALRHYMACDTLIDLTRKKITTESDKLRLGELASGIYSDAIRMLVPANRDKPAEIPGTPDDRFARAFYFSEKNKTSVLLEEIANQKAIRFAGIPDRLLQTEYNLKTDIAFYTNKLADPDQLDSFRLELYKDRLFRSNRRYDSLIVVFEKQHPEYYNLKYKYQPASAEEIGKLLDKNSALVSYFTGDSTLTIFTLSGKKLLAVSIPRIRGLNDTVELFRNGLTLGIPEIIRKYGNILYRQFFPGTFDRHIKNLMVIPDGRLATLPFESLLTETWRGDSEAYGDFPFMIKKYNLFYSYSGSLFFQNRKRDYSHESRNAGEWLGFAPVFNNGSGQPVAESSRELLRHAWSLKRDTLLVNYSLSRGDRIEPLPATESEVEGIARLYRENNLQAKALLHEDANEKNVKSGETGEYRILHFATHGFTDTDKPELSGLLLAQDTTGGEDGVLYTGEMYNLKLNADLVVLSACETGLGKIQKGEGVMGLARALLYAGANNIMVSLWSVNDISTNTIMLEFYRKLITSGRRSSYPEALRAAKLKMIGSGKFSSPFYWSPFILIGQ